MDNILQGLMSILDPFVLLLMVIGVLAGIIIGALPGLTGPMALGLAIPITFGMGPLHAIILLLGIHFGALYGGSITAILINTPGTPAGAATALDGYPLTLKGESKKALQTSAVSALIGAIISVTALIILAPLLAKVALRFGPSEYFALGIFGLSVVAAIAGKSLSKALIAAAVGVFISTIGTDPLYGAERFTFGSSFMYSGIDIVAAMIGLFAVAGVLNQFYINSNDQQDTTAKVSGNSMTFADFKRILKTSIKGGSIGAFVGSLPGAGATISSFFSYSESVRSSKNPEAFGKGEIKGVAAAESGAVGTESSAMIPLLTLGIPGDVATAILLGAFQLHGLRFGSDLFTKSGDLVYAMFIGIFVIVLMVFIVGWFGSTLVAQVVKVKSQYLYPVIVILVVAGTFALMNNLFNTWVALALGVVGFIMMRADYPVAPLLLGLILGPIVETNFILAMSASGGDIVSFLIRPITASILILAVVSVFFSIKVQRKIQKSHSH